MNLDVKDFTGLFLVLLPGLVASSIFFALTAHPIADEFERIVQAKRFVQTLVFAALARLIVHLIRFGLFGLSGWISWGSWDADVEFDWSVVAGVLIGLGFASGFNRDIHHRMLRAVGLSSRSSYPSEWYAAFSTYPRYVLLHLQGGRRLRGWPEQWPEQPKFGHFLLARPEWLVGDQVASLHQVERFLVPASEVVMVEFLRAPEEIAVDPAELKRVHNLIQAEHQKATTDERQPTST